VSETSGLANQEQTMTSTPKGRHVDGTKLTPEPISTSGSTPASRTRADGTSPSCPPPGGPLEEWMRVPGRLEIVFAVYAGSVALTMVAIDWPILAIHNGLICALAATLAVLEVRAARIPHIRSAKP
jgi:hypothetical protein